MTLFEDICIAILSVIALIASVGFGSAAIAQEIVKALGW